jgi:tetratricopeptide (TPR) repeat protein
LASALATLELEAGNVRKARKLFRHSLVQPTENAIAQARWASDHAKHLELAVDSFLDHSPEARAWSSTESGDWDVALSHALLWLADQPFSSGPAVHASYVASVPLARFADAARIARLGLEANPRDVVLLNNLVFSLASAGQISEAEEAFSQLPHRDLAIHHEIPWLATSGLLHFRRGNPVEGRRLYSEAIARASRASPKMLALASLYLAREEILVGSDAARDATDRALQAVARAPSQDVLVVAEQIRLLLRERPLGGQG